MSKFNFDDIYASANPLDYYRTLSKLDYEIPAHSASMFGQVADQLEVPDPTVVDLCCSYGVNATVLNHDVEFGDVIDHYLDADASGLGTEEMVARDREWFSQKTVDEPLQVYGLDTSAPAINYATNAGLLHNGFDDDLETADPSPELAEVLPDVDLLAVSGGIGYITEATVGKLLEQADRPWLAALCLRWVDFSGIIGTARDHGMVTERLDDTTFRQRRFTDHEEGAHAIRALEQLGIDYEGRESEGWHHADFYLIRPEDDAAAKPLAQFVDPADGVRSPGAGSALQVTRL